MTYESDPVAAHLATRCGPCEQGQHEQCELLSREDNKHADCRCLHDDRRMHALVRIDRARELLAGGDLGEAIRNLNASILIAKRLADGEPLEPWMERTAALAPLTGERALATVHPLLRRGPARDLLTIPGSKP